MTGNKPKKGCLKCHLVFPQYPELEHCLQCGAKLVSIKEAKE